MTDENSYNYLNKACILSKYKLLEKGLDIVVYSKDDFSYHQHLKRYMIYFVRRALKDGLFENLKKLPFQ